MIQHHLIYHFTSLEDNNTYYEANPPAAYYLVRSGKILHLVKDRLGEYAARVMETILFLGHASVTHLETLPELRYLKPTAPNGITNGHDETALQDSEVDMNDQPVETNGDYAQEEQQDAKPAPLHSTLKALASHGYLKSVRDAHFQSPSDRILEAQRAVSTRPDIKALKGKRQQEAIENATENLLADRTNADLAEGLMIDNIPRGIKRKFGHGSYAPKVESLSVNGVNGNGVHEVKNEAQNDWPQDENDFDEDPMEVRNYIQLTVRLNILQRQLTFQSLN